MRVRPGMRAVWHEGLDRPGWHTQPLTGDWPRVADALGDHTPGALVIEAARTWGLPHAIMIHIASWTGVAVQREPTCATHRTWAGTAVSSHTGWWR
jgi:hypothetical protein